LADVRSFMPAQGGSVMSPVSCGSPSSSSGGGGGGGGGGGASGFGLPPIVVIGVPFIPYEDTDTLYVDGTEVA